MGEHDGFYSFVTRCIVIRRIQAIRILFLLFSFVVFQFPFSFFLLPVSVPIPTSSVCFTKQAPAQPQPNRKNKTCNSQPCMCARKILANKERKILKSRGHPYSVPRRGQKRPDQISSSPPPLLDTSTARRTSFSANTGPLPSHSAARFSRSHTSAMSTCPLLTSGCSTM